ncbi:hypothetical protein L1987_70649 [Smallanthus sonchifolius]|uniref:Uncharacterized protein n=1 Tax=Smallanthus sonchifolius TaxID=185202 RepID=A0ACB9AQ93_9ASTR|nr:hypothetical protein L1987_70649 [Smallanthus sonchifolius]
MKFEAQTTSGSPAGTVKTPSKAANASPVVGTGSTLTPEINVTKPSTPKPHTETTTEPATYFEKEVDAELLKAWLGQQLGRRLHQLVILKLY